MRKFFRHLSAAFLLVLGPTSISAEITNEIRQNHVLFTKGGSTLDEEAQTQISNLGQVLKASAMMNACLRLVGYSDASGGDAINRSISQERAESVAAALIEADINPLRIVEVEGAGAVDFLEAIAATDPSQRRVAIFARDCDPQL